MISVAAIRPPPDSRGISRCGHERAGVQRQVHEQLFAPLIREEVDDAVQCLIGAVGVQRGQYQMAGFGELDGVFHGLAVAHLADENDIRGLPQGVLQRRMPGLGVDGPLHGA